MDGLEFPLYLLQAFVPLLVIDHTYRKGPDIAQLLLHGTFIQAPVQVGEIGVVSPAQLCPADLPAVSAAVWGFVF